MKAIRETNASPPPPLLLVCLLVCLHSGNDGFGKRTGRCAASTHGDVMSARKRS